MGYERWSVPPELKAKMHDLAAQLRKDHTESEEILWQALRGRKLDGCKFRRQNPIGAFVVDFLCAEENLVIEVDGAIHEQQRESDALRHEIIESLGLRFLRFSAAEVEHNLNGVLDVIKRSFQK
jgi:very-short-patch-repair endonuclease